MDYRDPMTDHTPVRPVTRQPALLTVVNIDGRLVRFQDEHGVFWTMEVPDVTEFEIGKVFTNEQTQ